MPQIDTAPDADTQRRAQRTASKLAGLTHREVEALMRDGAKAIAETLIEAGIPIDTPRFRPDVGPVQIDMIIIEEKVTQPQPGMRLQFDVDGGMGVTLTIKLIEFIKDPEAYVRDLFTQLGPMRRNVLRLRRHKRDANDAIYRALTEGAANG